MHLYAAGQVVRSIEFSPDFDGSLSDMQFTEDGYLILLFKYARWILMYQVEDCNALRCEPCLKLDASFFRERGVPYFSPFALEVARQLPGSFMVLTDTRMLVLQVGKGLF